VEDDGVLIQETRERPFLGHVGLPCRLINVSKRLAIDGHDVPVYGAEVPH
jgi:hypothetical protein